MMKNGFDLAEFAREKQHWRAAHPEEARLKDEIRKLSGACMILQVTRDCEWLTQAEVAAILGVHRGTIGRAVRSGKLQTNGEDGRLCLVSPRSLAEYCAGPRGAR